MTSPEFEPDLGKFYEKEENALAARLDAIRAVLSHSGEKGRALEAVVSKLLRSILPSEYGLSTGFIAYEDENGDFRLSSQLDIIIYDALRCGPLARLEACDVFPLEAVYGYLEVKAAIRTSRKKELPPDSLEYCVKQCAQLRDMTIRRYYRPKSGTKTEAEPVTIGNDKKKELLSIRSWVFAFEAKGRISKAGYLSQRLADCSADPYLDLQPHVHGLFVAGYGYFGTVSEELPPGVRRSKYEVGFNTTHPLSAFKWSLLHDLARFWRFPQGWTPAVHRYVSPLKYENLKSSVVAPIASAITPHVTEESLDAFIKRLERGEKS